MDGWRNRDQNPRTRLDNSSSAEAAKWFGATADGWRNRDQNPRTRLDNSSSAEAARWFGATADGWRNHDQNPRTRLDNNSSAEAARWLGATTDGWLNHDQNLRTRLDNSSSLCAGVAMISGNRIGSVGIGCRLRPTRTHVCFVWCGSVAHGGKCNLHVWAEMHPCSCVVIVVGGEVYYRV